MPGSRASMLLTMELCLAVLPMLCVLKLNRTGQPTSAPTLLTSDGRKDEKQDLKTADLVHPRKCELCGEFSRSSFELVFASQ